MGEKLNKGVEGLKNIVMTADEKKHMLESIVNTPASPYQPARSPYGFQFFSYFQGKHLRVFQYISVACLILIVSGVGVVFASNNALPGSLLFPVELALENIQLKLSGKEKKQELELRFTEERLAKVKKVSEKRSIPSDSGKARSVNFSPRESNDVNEVLSGAEKFLGSDQHDEDENKKELRKSLADIRVFLGYDKDIDTRSDDTDIERENSDDDRNERNDDDGSNDDVRDEGNDDSRDGKEDDNDKNGDEDKNEDDQNDVLDDVEDIIKEVEIPLTNDKVLPW